MHDKLKLVLLAQGIWVFRFRCLTSIFGGVLPPLQFFLDSLVPYRICLLSRCEVSPVVFASVVCLFRLVLVFFFCPWKCDRLARFSFVSFALLAGFSCSVAISNNTLTLAFVRNTPRLAYRTRYSKRTILQLCNEMKSHSCIQWLFQERLSKNVHATITKVIVGGFECTVLQKKKERMTHTLGTRGFSRVRREFSVLNEGRHIFGRRPKPRAAITIKNWQKPETALEKSLAPRVNDIRTYLHMFASAKDSNKNGFDSYSRYKQCIDHIPYYLSGFCMHIFSK